MATSTDKPGVAAPPPLLYGGAFVLFLVLRWFWPMPIFGHAVALSVWPCIGRARRWDRGMGKTSDAGRRYEHESRAPHHRHRRIRSVSLSRNPLYLALTLLYLGLTLAFNTWWGIVVLVPVLIIMHRGVVLREERYLEQKFGETYRQYRSKVRRYL